MSNPRKKIIRKWDGGVKTSSRSSDFETSDGAQVISHFDIYSEPNKMTPMPAWESFTTDAEKAYNIKAVGGYGETLYGVGKGLTDWYGTQWAYRVKITVDPTKYLGSGIPLRINLADMPVSFWANVKTDGGDVRVTNETNETLGAKLENFNTTSQSGDLWVESGFSTYVYIYYGNPTATAIPTSIQGFNYRNSSTDAFLGTNMRFAFNFPNDNYNSTFGNEKFLSDPTYVASSFGKGIYTNSLMITDKNDQVALGGSDITVSFRIKLNSLPITDRKIMGDNNGTWSVTIDTAGRVAWFARGNSGNATVVNTTPLTVGSWQVVDCIFDKDYYIAIDGVKQTFVRGFGNYQPIFSNVTLDVNTFGFCYIADLWGFNDDLSNSQIATKYSNLTNASTFWSFGAQESFTSTSHDYAGVQVWEKSILSGNWTENIQAGQPAKISNMYPVNGFVEVDGDIYFIVSQEENAGGFLYLAKTDLLLGIDESHLLLSVLPLSYKLLPTSDSPSDNRTYFTYGNSNLGKLTEPSAASVFALPTPIVSIMPWRTYLALGGTRRTRAYMRLWDLISGNFAETIDCGTGNLRIAGNTQDTLFAVVDNYIDSDLLSSGQPAMDIREYIGNGQTRSAIKLRVPSTYTGWTSTWERAISFFKIRRNTETLFYAKLPANDTATEFYEGLWAVGKDAYGLSLSLLIDTAGLGEPESIHGFAQQVFFVQKDGGIQKLSDDTYTRTSVWKSLKMNEGNSEVKKKLIGCELITTPLDENQIYSIYYKTDSINDRIKIGEFTGTGKISKEWLKDSDAKNLKQYKEIEFWIESINGTASGLEFNYKWEYTSDII